MCRFQRERPPGSVCCRVFPEHGRAGSSSRETDSSGCPDPEGPTALGSFHVASGEEAALCEHPGVVILDYRIVIVVVKSHRHHFHFIIVVTDQTLTLGWIASQG